MRKSKIKVVKKALLQNIKETLVKDLKETTSEIVKNSKKWDKLINKESKKLVKQLAKKLKINKAAIKSNDRPSVPLEETGISNSAKFIASKRKKKSPSAKVASPVTAPAVSSESSTAPVVKKTPVARKPKTTE